MKKFTVGVFTLIIFFSSILAQDYSLSSPDNKLKLNVEISDSIFYSIQKNNATIIFPSAINMKFLSGETWGVNKKMISVKDSSVNNLLHPEYGIKSEIIDSYNQIEFEFDQDFKIQFRLYNNGFAYRFVGQREIRASVVSELATFNIGEDAEIFFNKTQKLQQPFEGNFLQTRISDLKKESFAISPVLIRKKDVTLLISEADLQSYPGMFIQKSKDYPFQFEGKFAEFVTKQDIQTAGKISPVKMPYFSKLMVKKRGDFIAKVSKNRTFPWRVILIEDKEIDLLSNTLIYQLGPKSEEENWDWVKPGKVAWDWYHSWDIPGVDFKSGINTETYKYYIDFAHKWGFEYINLDFGWSHLWDLSESVKDIDLQEVLSYAKEKNVGVFLWMVWYELDRKMIQYLDLFEKWGVAGLKIDFMDRDDQQVVEFFERIAAESAKRKILINLHGAYKPTGLARKYPNLINREGVLGLENNKFSENCTPEHNVTLPFTRNALGPMDYTPGSMRHTTPDKFKKNWTKPSSMTARIQQMAMYVVYYGPLQMISDSPTLYPDTVLQFLSKVPVTWDETIPLEGKAGEYVVVARRSGEEWFIAGMNNNKERTINVNFDFLKQKIYDVVLYEEGDDIEDIKISKFEINTIGSQSIFMKKTGGFIYFFTPITN